MLPFSELRLPPKEPMPPINIEGQSLGMGSVILCPSYDHTMTMSFVRGKPITRFHIFALYISFSSKDMSTVGGPPNCF